MSYTVTNPGKKDSYVNPLFSKPVYSTITDIDTKKILSLLGDDVEFQTDEDNNYGNAILELEDWNKQHKMFSVTSNLNILDDNKFKWLKDKLMKEFYLYASGVLKYTNEFEITNSWVTMSAKGQSQNFHNHSNCMYSMVLYLQSNEKSGNIIFDSMARERFALYMEEYNIINSPQWSINPENGMLLIFPSEVHHAVTENKSDTTRFSLAINLLPIGELGVGSSQTGERVKITVEK
jgi:uncharacterized protein (TIGR02466 family)